MVYYKDINFAESTSESAGAFWCLILSILGLYSGTKYYKKPRIGIFALFAILGAPLVLLEIAVASIKIVYFYILSLVQYGDMFFEAIKRIWE